MNIRSLRKSDLSDYAHLVHYAFGAPPPRAERYAQFVAKYLQYSLGAFDGSRMLAGMWYYPYNMRVGEDMLPMGGVAAVATFPEARNRQLVRKMMTQGHAQMRDEGRPVAVLMPFRGSFYARMGYEHTFYYNEWTFTPHDLARPPKHRATVRRVDGITEWKALDQVHQQAGRRYTGTTIRDKAYWSHKWLGEEESVLTVFLAEHAGDPVGYLLTRRTFDTDRKQLYRIVDSAWTDRDAFHALLNILWVHRDQARNITWDLPCNVDLFPFFAEPETQSTRVKPKKMLKIVDLKGAIERRSYPDDLEAEIVFDVEADPTSTWNRGMWKVTWENGHAEVRRTRSSRASRVALSIGTLAILYSGYRNAGSLHTLGRIDCPPETCTVLTRAFGTQPLYMREWF